MTLRILAIAVAATVLAHGQAGAQTLQARLDRNPIRVDETVRLIVEADARAGESRLDLAALRLDFEILGQSTSTHVAIENGARSVRTEWMIELAPRRPGRFAIGPLSVGTMTSPTIELEVLPASSTQAQSARDVFLEMEVTPREVYVQSQIVCVLRIYRASEFLEAKLSEFDPDRAVTHRLGRDSTYTKVIDGRRYRIIERRFAVFAQASGPLTLPAFRLDARIAEPGAASTMGRLFGEGRRVRIATQPVDVVVKPRPDAGVTPWLPATAVTLTGEWPDEPPRLVAGEPVTWTLRLGATGLAGEQLPPIEPPAIEGVRVYPDQPSIATPHQRSGRARGARGAPRDCARRGGNADAPRAAGAVVGRRGGRATHRTDSGTDDIRRAGSGIGRRAPPCACRLAGGGADESAALAGRKRRAGLRMAGDAGGSRARPRPAGPNRCSIGGAGRKNRRGTPRRRALACWMHAMRRTPARRATRC